MCNGYTSMPCFLNRCMVRDESSPPDESTTACTRSPASHAPDHSVKQPHVESICRRDALNPPLKPRIGSRCYSTRPHSGDHQFFAEESHEMSIDYGEVTREVDVLQEVGGLLHPESRHVLNQLRAGGFRVAKSGEKTPESVFLAPIE